MNEKRKWLLVSALGPVLLVVVWLRLKPQPAGSPGGAAVPPGAAAARTAAAPAPADGAQAVELARASLARRGAGWRLPERDLFAPGRPAAAVAPAAGAQPDLAAPAAESAPPADTRPRAGLRLQATLLDGGSRMAIVNGRSLREGDTMDGWTLEKVEADRAVFLHRGESHVLTLQDR